MTSVTNGIEPIRPFGGFKPGEIIMVSSPSRSTGKSMYMQMLKSRITNDNLCKEIILPMNKKRFEPKYKFSRKTWYTISLFNIDDPIVSGTRLSRIEWCAKQFGQHPKNPDAWTRWYVDYQSLKLVFRDLKDYQLYLLKWS